MNRPRTLQDLKTNIQEEIANIKEIGLWKKKSK